MVDFNVRPIKYKEVKRWLLDKHYAHRIPSICYSYGLYINGLLEGVITYGISPSIALGASICGKKYKNDVLELNRLVINSNTPKNSASFLVGNSLKMLPKKRWIIISFADLNIGHIGYVYQSTNFFYTGMSSVCKGYIDKDGSDYHYRNFKHQKERYTKKKRIHINNIDKNKVFEYLKKNKENNKILSKDIDYFMEIKGYKLRWSDIKNLNYLPSIDEWKELKRIIGFDCKYDRFFLEYKEDYSIKTHINDMNLKEIILKPKHRYILFLGTRKEKKELRKSLLLNIQSYPKGKPSRYKCIDIVEKNVSLMSFSSDYNKEKHSSDTRNL